MFVRSSVHHSLMLRRSTPFFATAKTQKPAGSSSSRSTSARATESAGFSSTLSNMWKKHVVGEETILDNFNDYDDAGSAADSSNQNKKSTVRYGANGKIKEAEKDKQEVKQRIYITGFEHHPYYSPENYKNELRKRGFKPHQFADQQYGATTKNNMKIKQQKDAQTADTRFSQKLTDFRQIQDDDPYAPLFGEREHVSKMRTKEWQSQFERENASVEIPYDRDGFVARMMPNWFVRMTCRLRENAGFDPVYPVLFGVIVISIVATYYIGTNRMKGEEEDMKYVA